MQTKFDLTQKKIDLYEQIKQSDETVAEILKKDLENLTYIMKNNVLKYDDGDDSLLRVANYYQKRINNLLKKNKR